MIDDLVGAEFPVRYGTPAASRRRFNNAVAVVGAQQEFQHRRARDILTKLTWRKIIVPKKIRIRNSGRLSGTETNHHLLRLIEPLWQSSWREWENQKKNSKTTVMPTQRNNQYHLN